MIFDLSFCPNAVNLSLLQMRENVRKTLRGRRSGRESGSHDQRQTDGLRRDGGGEPSGARVFLGPGNARPALAGRTPRAGHPDAVVPGGTGSGGRGGRRPPCSRAALAVRCGRVGHPCGHRVPARYHNARSAARLRRSVLPGRTAPNRGVRARRPTADADAPGEMRRTKNAARQLPSTARHTAVTSTAVIGVVFKPRMLNSAIA